MTKAEEFSSIFLNDEKMESQVNDCCFFESTMKKLVVEFGLA